MTRHPQFGLWLALFGVLVLTPDAMFMRLSGMGPLEMLGWRGLLMGSVMILAWAIFSGDRGRDLRVLASGYGLGAAACHCVNAALFSYGIGTAPVAMVVLGVATVPIFAALLARLLMGTPTRRATWVAIAVVIAGIAVSVFGGGGRVSIDVAALRGVLVGLGVALALALNFVLFRARPDLPIPLVIGLGAATAGTIGALTVGAGAMAEGRIWAIAICGAVILPVSFFCMSLASRHTQAANVSLLMLLEVVLAPFWVWLVLDEAMTGAMLAGGLIVILGVGGYVLHTGRTGAAARRARALRG